MVEAEVRVSQDDASSSFCEQAWSMPLFEGISGSLSKSGPSVQSGVQYSQQSGADFPPVSAADVVQQGQPPGIPQPVFKMSVCDCPLLEHQHLERRLRQKDYILGHSVLQRETLSQLTPGSLNSCIKNTCVL